MRFMIVAAFLSLTACGAGGGGLSTNIPLDLPTAGRGQSGDSPFAANRGAAPPPPSSVANAGQTPPPEGAGPGGIDFGQWRTSDPDPYSAAFQQQIRQRFASTSRADARADLERNGFACAERTGVTECRIEIMEAQCAKDWWVALEAESDAPRAGFDLMCLGAQ